MKKTDNNRISKTIVSVILTGLFVTGITFAATWEELGDNDVVTGTHWQNLVSAVSNSLDKTGGDMIIGDTVLKDGIQINGEDTRNLLMVQNGNSVFGSIARPGEIHSKGDPIVRVNDNNNDKTYKTYKLYHEGNLDTPATDLSNYYTISEAQETFTDPSEALNLIVSSCKVCFAWADRDYALRESGAGVDFEYSCRGFNQGFAAIHTEGNVNGDDTFGMKIVCETGNWGAASGSNVSTGCIDNWGTGGSAKSGACYPGDTHTYYGGSTTGCTIPPRGGDPATIGTIYSKKYNQTCN